ncbi:hypothetical protein GP486_007097 [Trichoglossum hirsutum]|uniref:Manganese/iron superoxide dismutase C-terminal domain-containing protein n=1 Tax=Trichoglossum hirsutum TaxID=265104 RepID=A0A9P8L727_9PEZI|nr:hypothetical protein GP486_007097 [Trichoglossum hirsutum]
MFPSLSTSFPTVDILGVSLYSYISHDYRFPIIHDSPPNIIPALGLLHPLGGGREALDAVVVLDACGRRRMVLPVGWGQSRHYAAPDELLKNTMAKLMANLVDGLQWLDRESREQREQELEKMERRASAQTRQLHHVPPLTHGESFKRDGIPGVLSAEGYEIAWLQYQRLMVDKLNLLTAGTPDENASTKTLLLTYARQADMASLFNHASMAHNNHFFFNCLSPKPTKIPPSLASRLTEEFSSLETLRLEIIATAAAMFGPGYVWLVKNTDKSRFSLLTTYLAGSPYPGAHFRRQAIDMNTESAQSFPNLSAAEYARQNIVQNSAGAFGKSSATSVSTGGVGLMPVLCVNTWEHVWLRDWGVGGKRGFLEAWWNMVDWNVVASNADVDHHVSTKALSRMGKI